MPADAKKNDDRAPSDGKDGSRIEQLLAALYGTNDPGWLEIRLIRPSAKTGNEVRKFFFSWPKDIPAIIRKVHEASGSWNVYFGVCLREKKDGHLASIKRVHALWADIDLKAIGSADPEKRAQELIRGLTAKFPCTAVTWSGNGYHVYWRLKEPATSAEELAKIRPLLLGIARIIGGDKATCDLARILRVPGTPNLKYDPPRPSALMRLEPGCAYALEDWLSFVPPDEAAEPVTTGEPHEYSAKIPGQWLEMPIPLSKRLAPLIADIWLEGFRHRLALYFAGMMAHAGYSIQSTVALITAVATLCKDEELQARLTNVHTTYEKFVSEGLVAGAPTMDKMVREDFPEHIASKAEKILGIIRRSLPVKKNGQDGDSTDTSQGVGFEIVSIVRSALKDSQSLADLSGVTYTVVLKRCDIDKTLTVMIGAEALWRFEKFSQACWDQTGRVPTLKKVKNSTWTRILDSCNRTHDEIPEEGGVLGSVEGVLETWLHERREKPDDGTLRAFPGYNENSIYFQLSALQAQLNRANVRITRPELVTVLRRLLGWSYKRTASQRLWFKDLSKPESKNEAQNGKHPEQGKLFPGGNKS